MHYAQIVPALVGVLFSVVALAVALASADANRRGLAHTRRLVDELAQLRRISESAREYQAKIIGGVSNYADQLNARLRLVEAPRADALDRVEEAAASLVTVANALRRPGAVSQSVPDVTTDAPAGRDAAGKLMARFDESRLAVSLGKMFVAPEGVAYRTTKAVAPGPIADHHHDDDGPNQ